MGDDTLFDDPCVAIEESTCLLQWVSLRKLNLCECGLTSSTLAVISLGIRSGCHQLECSTAKARDLGDDIICDLLRECHQLNIATVHCSQSYPTVFKQELGRRFPRKKNWGSSRDTIKG